MPRQLCGGEPVFEQTLKNYHQPANDSFLATRAVPVSDIIASNRIRNVDRREDEIPFQYTVGDNC